MALFGIEDKLQHIAADVTKSVMKELNLASDIANIVKGIDFSPITTSVDNLTKEIHELALVNKKLIYLLEIKAKTKK